MVARFFFGRSSSDDWSSSSDTLALFDLGATGFLGLALVSAFFLGSSSLSLPLSEAKGSSMTFFLGFGFGLDVATVALSLAASFVDDGTGLMAVLALAVSSSTKNVCLSS